jgi:elongation factor G
MDKEHANFEKACNEIKQHMSEKAYAAEIPIGEGDQFRGIVNLFTGKAHIFKHGTATGEYEEAEIPDDLKDEAELRRTELFEAIATTNDALLERYLEGGEISTSEALNATKLAMLAGELFPIFCGAGERRGACARSWKRSARSCRAQPKRRTSWRSARVSIRSSS